LRVVQAFSPRGSASPPQFHRTRNDDYSHCKGLRTTKKSGSQTGKSAFQLIDARIKELGDWRGKMLGRLRGLIKEADPELVEEWKWDSPVWSHDGLVCTGETYQNVAKMTFARGACHRLPRGREDRRQSAEDARSRLGAHLSP